MSGGRTWAFRDGGSPPDEARHVGDVFAIGRNYTEHVREMGNADDVPIVVFQKARASLAHDGDTLMLPAWSSDVQFEGELVVLLGRGGRDIPIEHALSRVWGMAAGIDWTARDLQRAARTSGEPWFAAKNFAGAAAVGAFTPLASAGDWSHARLTLTVNGTVRQDDTIAHMRHSVAAIVAHLSRVVPLSAGDAIFTGTPAGVGPVQAGDVVCCTIDGVGSVTTRVAAS